MIAALFVATGGLRARFFAKTRRDNATGCLVWTGARNAKGYGQIAMTTSRPAYAHRVAWALETGAWPSQCLLHSCDNPACVEPTHLSEGTRAENNADMRAKGRARYAAPARGALSATAKLTNEEASQIRAATGKRIGQRLADQFGVSRSTISRIRRGVAW